MSKSSKIKWTEIAKDGLPPKELQKTPQGLNRQFLVRGEYSLAVCYLYHDGSGFDMPEGSMDEAQAWAIIEGF